MCAALTAEDEIHFFATQLFNGTSNVALAQPLQKQFCSRREPIRLNRKSNGRNMLTYMRTQLTEALKSSETTPNTAQSRPRESCPRHTRGAQDMRRPGDSALGACCSTSHGPATRRSQAPTRGTKATPTEEKRLLACCRVPWLVDYTEHSVFLGGGGGYSKFGTQSVGRYAA